MYQQMTIEARKEIERQILLCLHRLWNPEDAAPPAMGFYFPQWAAVQDAPEWALKNIVQQLQDEEKARKLKGDLRYFQTLSIGAKIAEYEFALQALRFELYGDDGSQLDEVVTQNAFKKLLGEAVLKYFETKERAYKAGAEEAPAFEAYAYRGELEREAKK